MATSINSVSSTGSTAAATATSATPATDDGQDRFLKLLITQMKNQDPMNPMDNAQVTTQMAQISTVSGISQLNQTITGIMSQFAGMETLQGAALAGRSVLVSGNSLSLAAGSAAAAFELPSAADQVTVTVFDGAGQAVHTANLGAAQAGLTRFEWDGKTDAGKSVADGRYTFSVKATAAGTTTAATPLALATVAGVSRGSNGLELDLGALGTRTLADIKRIQ